MEIFQIEEQGQLFISPSIDDWQHINDHNITVVCNMDYAVDKSVPQVLDQLLYV